MKTIIIVAFCSILFYSMAIAETEDSASFAPVHFSKHYFEDVYLTSTSITITMKSSGQRYFIRRADGTLHKTEYGESINIDMGDSITIVGRDGNISFSSLPDPIIMSGFTVKEEFINRMAQDTLESKSYYLVMPDSSMPRSWDQGGAYIYSASESSIINILEGQKK